MKNLLRRLQARAFFAWLRFSQRRSPRRAARLGLWAASAGAAVCLLSGAYVRAAVNAACFAVSLRQWRSTTKG